ncbi:apolipoprotein N-acyltransferase [Microbacterium sediminis]|uniref:Apolipoprotein N-acyltransferase n=1 Tax=Microbacterium sediminis TaxID=904291 RepID=A0A1B9N909_9MICO|nr:apolipoprotein N-acyltransferase [Microbacterium sediminis]OCG73092.1 apolipoprotein N-acyltransferase [Microbacterium sediminis]QBR74440.1 apolipoprotein N-acyltransferase [Microbacterium sediminis]
MPDRRPPLPLWAALIVAALGGLALDLSFPSAGTWPLAFVAVGMSLVTLIGRRAGAAFLVGLVFGAAFYFPHIDWAASFLGDNELAWVPWVALAGLESLFMGLGAIPIALAYHWTDRVRGGARLIAVPVLVSGLWTAREIAMGSWPYGGFAWGRIGMAMSEAPLAEAASWVGVSGLSFLCVLWAAMLVELGRFAARTRGAGPRRARALAVLPALGLIAALVLVPQFPTTPVGTIRVGAVQGNGPAAYMDDREYLDVLRAQLAATRELEGQDVDVVLWPEGGVDGDPRADERVARVLDDVVRDYDAPLLMNAASAVGDDIFNMSMLWTQDGPAQTHSKRHPVAFGEYVPDRAFFEAIVPSLIQMIGREYTPGTDSPVIDVGGVPIGLAICFDVVADGLIREGVFDGAQAYMFQTNNADFRGTDENLQQLAFARMRAIETGRSVVNLSTVGTSQVIAPDGTTIDQIGVDEAGAIVADVELREGLTAGVVSGQAIVWILLIGSPLALVGVFIARRRPRSQAAEAS